MLGWQSDANEPRREAASAASEKADGHFVGHGSTLLQITGRSEVRK